MRIIAGKFKGRIIPFNNKTYGMADTTTGRVKESIFSIIQMDISGKSFLDLFGCSGQIGFEALSRGAKPVYINEKNRLRFNFIRGFKDTIGVDDDLILFNMEYKQCLDYLSSNHLNFSYIFIDPPYEKRDVNKDIYKPILQDIENKNIMNNQSTIIVQHLSKIKLNDVYGTLEKKRIYNYGNNSLTFYLTK